LHQQLNLPGVAGAPRHLSNGQATMRIAMARERNFLTHAVRPNQTHARGLGRVPQARMQMQALSAIDERPNRVKNQ